MISQSLYHRFQCIVSDYFDESFVPMDSEIAQFVRPRILVIHRPSGRGFYLDRDMQHLIDVDCCRIPENPAKIKRHYLGMDPDFPEWVNKIVFPKETGDSCDYSEFDSYWLY